MWPFKKKIPPITYPRPTSYLDAQQAPWNAEGVLNEPLLSIANEMVVGASGDEIDYFDDGLLARLAWEIHHLKERVTELERVVAP